VVHQVTIDEIRRDQEINTYIQRSFDYLLHIGFTEHGLRHAGLVSDLSGRILRELGYSPREQELAAIAGYMHDMGNMINRFGHGHASALIAHSVLSRMGMPPSEIALVISAIGNHEEEYGHSVNSIAAALALADKSDVHRSRVCNKKDIVTFDIHDRVNFAAESSKIEIDAQKRIITLRIRIDQQICPIIEYFEIFLQRMLMCRRAAGFLGCEFELYINEANLM
jgi:metal-dependent HD superfamily phosphatase/phosphodiesterase